MNLEQLGRTRLDLVPMVGMRAVVPYKEAGGGDKAIFNRDFEVLAKQLDMVELGASFRDAKPFYEHALGAALSHLDKEVDTFEGIRCASTWGMKLIAPQDCGVITWDATNESTLMAWEKDIDLAVDSNWGDILGTSGTPLSPSSTADHKGVHAFHCLVSYRPIDMLQTLYYEILNVPYALFTVEAAAKGNGKIPSIIPLPAPFLALSTSNYYIGGCFDKGDPDIALSVRTAIGPFGLVFAEYNYLKQKLEG